MPYNPILSPSGNNIISYDYGYGEGTYLGIHTIKENDIKEEASFYIGYLNVQSVTWLNNDEVILNVYSNDNHSIRKLRIVKENDLWLIRRK